MMYKLLMHMHNVTMYAKCKELKAHTSYVTIFLIFLGASLILTLEKKLISPIVNFQFPLP